MSLQNCIETLFDEISSRTPIYSDEYIGDDGFLHCKACHDRIQTDVEVFGKKRRVRCICSCVKQMREAQEAKEREQLRKERRKNCFREAKMAAWNFANDDGANPIITKAMENYCKNFKTYRESGQGLLLYGAVGTGKTFYAACIANRLIDDGYGVYMTNFASLTNRIQATFDERQEIIESMNHYSLLIIDDLGAERNSDFMRETVFNIIDSRYRSGLPFIITTNLTADEIKKPQEISYQRIYDRVIERCFPVEVKGSSRRRAKLKKTYFDIKKDLGL